MQRPALKYAIETFHDDQRANCHANGRDPIKVVSWVASESWLFHQLLLHELGGLARFVDGMATSRLAEHAALARSWAEEHASAASWSGRASPAGACVSREDLPPTRGPRRSTWAPGPPPVMGDGCSGAWCRAASTTC